jgi:hypothetical protein
VTRSAENPIVLTVNPVQAPARTTYQSSTIQPEQLDDVPEPYTGYRCENQKLRCSARAITATRWRVVRAAVFVAVAYLWLFTRVSYFPIAMWIEWILV